MAKINGFQYGAELLCKSSFPATLEADNLPCIIEVMVYRLNAVAATSYSLDGEDPLLHFLGLDKTDTYITRHEIDDLFTAVHARREAEPWQQ